MTLVEYMMSFRYINGNTQTKSIKVVEAESDVLVRKGYVEVNPSYEIDLNYYRLAS
jgi:hypothetical protein